MTDRIFLNSRLPNSLPATAVLVRDGAIALAGETSEVRAAASRPDIVDVGGGTLLPAFIDAHIHILGLAARLLAVDCSPNIADSISAIQERIRAAAARAPAGAWIRAAGYDELALAERRHPTRQDLDAAAPEHPVRLQHRGGHAVVLNSRAMKLAGISAATPEPPGGYMERDLESGEPTGLLIEMEDIVDRALPPLRREELEAAAGQASQLLLAAGITCFEDATATNGLEEWRIIEGLVESGRLAQRVSMMEGYQHLGELPEQGAGGRLTRGPVKVMPRELEHEFSPAPEELASMLRRITEAGRTAAVHAVTRGGVKAVVEAFDRLGPRARGSRIEHCGVCGLDEARRIAALGLSVVSQPSFLFWNGDLFRQRLDPSDVPDLYPLRRLTDAGVSVAGSSDAPVVVPDVLAGLRGAVERRTRAGAVLASEQALTAQEALDLYTARAAAVLGLDQERGRVAAGLPADFVVLDQDPLGPEVDWKTIHVKITVVGGEVAYRRE